ncbi:hypothetical protein TNIN_171351 [Trichonephila inaurata madagascariensis]|uniref:Uncharacterized protein n=1 Tax=Trichonephila inaurata madagascariensis TaxID=2747483 RepID=A0A8X7CN58_9ARAC|nr:hypothetical protein TNIN_171351 [Trichonephila inaurata madagascariensis]
MSDSDSDMDLNSDNSGYSSQSSRSGSPNSTISSKECRKLKNVMKRIRTVDKNIKKFESLILKHKTGAHTEGYKSSLKRSRKPGKLTFGSANRESTPSLQVPIPTPNPSVDSSPLHPDWAGIVAHFQFSPSTVLLV